LLAQLLTRLTSEQVAWVLNRQSHDVPILVAARLLKPLGYPPHNIVKFFAALEVLEQSKDHARLAKVTNALNQHWQNKSAAKKNYLAKGVINRHSKGEITGIAESGLETLNV
jgi:hypothetical protein